VVKLQLSRVADPAGPGRWPRVRWSGRRARCW